MEYWLNMQGILVKYALKVHLLDWKCHYFPRGVGVWREPPCHYVTFLRLPSNILVLLLILIIYHINIKNNIEHYFDKKNKIFQYRIDYLSQKFIKVHWIS